MTVMIAVDSTSDIPQERARSLDITIIPLLVLFGDESYRDGIDLTTDEFYKKLTTSQVTPTTSAPSIGAFQEAYEDMIRRGATGILQLCLSAKLSATYSAAIQAAEMVSKEKNIPIEVVDSATVSAAFGLPAQMLAQEARDGASLEQLKARAPEYSLARPSLRRARHAGVPAPGRAHRAGRRPSRDRCSR